MSAPAFTSGPWAVHPFRASVYVVPAAHVQRPIGGAEDAEYDLAHYAQEVCLMHHPDPHRTESEVRANARLIAAAPDLYEALNAICEELRDGNDFDAAQIAQHAGYLALAKARDEQVPA